MHHHNEKAFEEHIENALQGSGFVTGSPSHFNAKFAVDTHWFWQFLERSQPDEVDKLKHRHADYQAVVLERLDRLLKKDGLLKLFRKGFEVDNATFTLMYPRPNEASSDAAKAAFAKNIWSVTRQVHYSLANPNLSVDMVLFLNGLPIATLELKSPYTQQTVRHAIAQYKNDRSNKEALFHFARCLVHFAVDTDDVFMSTKISGKDTVFLPFNRGANGGKGNPPNPHGYKTAYLWQEILMPNNFAQIISDFMRLGNDKNAPLADGTLFFPRYHQWDVVKKLLAHSGTHGIGQRYLIQHSAGSGKSNSIAWTAFGLLGVYHQGDKLFDSVVVVTDRRLLDRQTRNNIHAFAQVEGIVAAVDSAKKLKEALENKKKIIITTIQKFPFIADAIADLSAYRFGIIIDEAHSSQSGTSADNMNRAMGLGDSADDADDPQDASESLLDLVEQNIRRRKQRSNVSYFAFTATPKNTTLEKFGEKQSDGTFRPFHLYSMKQAIEEGFILDVLANYTTYKSYYQIQKSVDDNPEFDRQKAHKKLKAYVEQHQQTIAVKAEIMLSHFTQQVVAGKRLKGKGKAMVVCHNIESAIHYFDAITALLKEKGNPFKAAIAFSGEKVVNGVTRTESSCNGFDDSKTAERFSGDDYRILVVANKYLTGFDEPKLCAMYVDKRLRGVLCVQALSRLNRSAPKWGKRTEDLFVLDFFNDTADIQAAFEPFYTATVLNSATDINVLNDLSDELGEYGVYADETVENFAEKFFNNAPTSELNPIIDGCVAAFDQMEQADKVDFKIKAKQFVKIYGQMAAVIDFEKAAWEKLYWLLKFLVPKLSVKDSDEEDKLKDLLDSVDLDTYALARDALGVHIRLSGEEGELNPTNPNPRSGHSGEGDSDPLELIINEFNKHAFDGWADTPEDGRVRFIKLLDKVAQHKDFDLLYVNNTDEASKNRYFAKMVHDVMGEISRQEINIYRQFVSDEIQRNAFIASLRHAMEVRLRR